MLRGSPLSALPRFSFRWSHLLPPLCVFSHPSFGSFRRFLLFCCLALLLLCLIPFWFRVFCAFASLLLALLGSFCFDGLCAFGFCLLHHAWPPRAAPLPLDFSRPLSLFALCSSFCLCSPLSARRWALACIDSLHPLLLVSPFLLCSPFPAFPPPRTGVVVSPWPLSFVRLRSSLRLSLTTPTRRRRPRALAWSCRLRGFPGRFRICGSALLRLVLCVGSVCPSSRPPACAVPRQRGFPSGIWAHLSHLSPSILPIFRALRRRWAVPRRLGGRLLLLLDAAWWFWCACCCAAYAQSPLECVFPWPLRGVLRSVAFASGFPLPLPGAISRRRLSSRSRTPASWLLLGVACRPLVTPLPGYLPSPRARCAFVPRLS